MLRSQLPIAVRNMNSSGMAPSGMRGNHPVSACPFAVGSGRSIQQISGPLVSMQALTLSRSGSGNLRTSGYPSKSCIIPAENH